MRTTLLKTSLLSILVCVLPAQLITATPEALRVGMAGHAFDHLGDIGDQAETAAASGANIIYCTALGSLGYAGLPPEPKLQQSQLEAAAYIKNAKAHGIKLAIGYVCATSIVGLDTFDKNWTPEFRSQFHTPPSQWRQQDRHGNFVRSWYEGKYEAACMNNPDWRVYEKSVVRMQFEAGADGIFFDNPTVHQDGCYCPFCMEKFAFYLASNGHKDWLAKDGGFEALRHIASQHPREFMEFRATIARDFLAEMQSFARSVKRDAYITCNNSLNSPDAFFSQCRRYAYDIDELSKAEDWITVEDMTTQPRLLPDGRTVEYGPVYRMLRAISHGKPVVAVVLADADYHTAPDLARLAMAEAAANGASYLSWPTWPKSVRQKMAAALRPEADFLCANAKLLNDVEPRSEVVVLLSFQRWLDTDNCAALRVCDALARANVQFTVTSDDELKNALRSRRNKSPILVIEQSSLLNEQERQCVTAFQRNGGQVVEASAKDWLSRTVLKNRALTIEGAPNLRAVVADQGSHTFVHLYNLGIERLSSFEDKVHPVANARIKVSVPFTKVKSVTALSADEGATTGALDFTSRHDSKEAVVEFTVPKIEIGTIVRIDGK